MSCKKSDKKGNKKAVVNDRLLSTTVRGIHE